MPANEQVVARGRLKFDRGIVVPILVATLGTGSLLTTCGILPGVQWTIVLGMAVLGVLILMLSGIDKASIIAGPTLMICAFLSLLRQTERLQLDTEIPLIMMTIGVLWTAAYMLPIPIPAWILRESAATNAPVPSSLAGSSTKETR